MNENIMPAMNVNGEETSLTTKMLGVLTFNKDKMSQIGKNSNDLKIALAIIAVHSVLWLNTQGRDITNGGAFSIQNLITGGGLIGLLFLYVLLVFSPRIAHYANSKIPKEENTLSASSVVSVLGFCFLWMILTIPLYSLAFQIGPIGNAITLVCFLTGVSAQAGRNIFGSSSGSRNW